MKNLKYKLLLTVINLTFYSILISSSKTDNLSNLSSNLNSLTQYSSIVKPIIPITPPPGPKPVTPPTPRTPKKLVKRKKFFKKVVGMDEQKFRSDYKWQRVSGEDYGELTNRPDDTTENKLSWIQQYPTRAAIFQGRYKMYTAGQLKGLIKNPLTHYPYFRIIIHNPQNEEQTDIAYLQSDPNLKNANFQVASTFFGPLEGGMYDYNAFLSGMFHSPVQGEEASISAAPATIFRKYFMLPDYLLQNLDEYFTITKGRHAHSAKVNRGYQFKVEDTEKVGVGIHQDIVVTGGYKTGRGENDNQEHLPVYVVNGKVDTSKTQIINQIFTAAYNTTAYDKQKKPYGSRYPNEVAASRMILQGMYLGAISAPWVTGNPVIFLTLLGAGAFRNDPDWLAEAIERLRDIIKNYGLQVTLIYRPDPGKAPVRTADIDLKFLRRMFAMADYINNTNLAQDKTFKQILGQYTQAAYSNNTVNQADAAHKLNTMINHDLPTYAPRIQLTATTPITTPASKPETPSTTGQFTQILALDNGDKIGWLKVSNDAVLINLGKNTQPTSSNFKFINPDVPTARLPKGLYFWKSQNPNLGSNDIGKHKRGTFVRNNPKGKDYIYSKTKDGQAIYVDSHHKNIIWDVNNPNIKTIHF